MSETTAVVFYYLDYKDCSSRLEHRLLSCLLRQLLSQLEHVPPSVEVLYDTSLTRSKNTNYSTLVNEFIRCAGQFHTIYVFVDALDECGDDQRDVIVAFLHKLLVNNAIIFKIIASSRPHLREHLASLPNTTQIMIEAEDIEGDVQTYIKSRLTSRHRLPRPLKEKALETITRGADGM